MTTTPTSSAAGSPRSSTPTSRRMRKLCSMKSCSRVDAGGGFCVSHGGGKKCSFTGCEKGYQTGGFCRKHGGGARCQVPGCGKVDAGRGFCRGHGGGKRCQTLGCLKADVGGGQCTAHGGGRRCTEAGCDKIDQGGGKCRAHGGAKRCRYTGGCAQTARGTSGLCPHHGGAKICAVANCRRLARGGDGDGDNATLCATCAKEELAVVAAVPTVLNSKRSSADPAQTPRASHSSRRVMPVDSDQSDSSSSDADSAPVRVTPEPQDTFTHAVYSSTRAPSLSSPVVVTPLDDAHTQRGPCDGSQVASCLENGCARSYGGACSCALDCQCNRPLVTTATAILATPTATNEAQSDTQEDISDALALWRCVVQIESPRDALNATVILALLAAADGVRSVHDAPLPTSEHGGDGNDTATTRVVAIVRCASPSDAAAALASLERLGAVCCVLEQRKLRWQCNEVVLHVPAMMCPGNCGATVVRAVHAVAGVETATLAFEHRHVVVRGAVTTAALCTAIDAIGFAPLVLSMTPLPRRFCFRVPALATVATATCLETVLRNVEGVERVVVNVEAAEVLVVAMLEDASTLLCAAQAIGCAMAVVADASSTTTAAAIAINDTHVDNDSDAERHVCDMNVCPHNRCDQYRATVAHTAALAIGWAVPGCAMTWGGECTCGEACKCQGCPTHNPAS